MMMMIMVMMMIMIIIIIPETLKYRVGVRWEIVWLMDRKNSSALGGSLSRDGVSMKTLVGKSEMSNQENYK